MASSAQKVFAIPELLELVLQHLKHLPLRQLFLLQCINKDFRPTIDKSTEFQQLMLIKSPEHVRQAYSINIINPVLKPEARLLTRAGMLIRREAGGIHNMWYVKFMLCATPLGTGVELATLPSWSRMRFARAMGTFRILVQFEDVIDRQMRFVVQHDVTLGQMVEVIEAYAERLRDGIGGSKTEKYGEFEVESVRLG